MSNTTQIEMVSLEMLVPKTHTYRKLKDLINIKRIVKSMDIKESETGSIGYTSERLGYCLILQFMEDISDREFERFISENTAGKWFCDFGILEKTPDFTTISKFRNKIGCKNISQMFGELKNQLTKKGFMSEVFTFVDATALVSKLAMWEERDKAIADGYEKFNNEVIAKYAKDNEVRIGAKSAKKFWIGYKKHVSVDMQSGMINKVAVTKANVPDGVGAKHVLPKTGAVVADKGYTKARAEIVKRGLHPMVILKQNMKEKNKYKDKFISKLRMPYENTFAHQRKRTRYKGVVKNQAAEFLYAIAFNLKRLIKIEALAF